MYGLKSIRGRREVGTIEDLSVHVVRKPYFLWIPMKNRHRSKRRIVKRPSSFGHKTWIFRLVYGYKEISVFLLTISTVIGRNWYPFLQVLRSAGNDPRRFAPTNKMRNGSVVTLVTCRFPDVMSRCQILFVVVLLRKV